MYKILIQNEDREDRAVLYELLREYDEEFEIYETKKKDEVMQIVHNKKIQIVITDSRVDMREIYNKFPYLEFILFSDIKEELFDEKIHVLVKPIQMDELKSTFTDVIKNLVKEESGKQIWTKEQAEERMIEKRVSIDKDERIIEDIRNVIALKNGEGLRNKLESLFNDYREMEERYPYYVRNMCMMILQLFLKSVPSKMSEIEKMAEFIFETKEFSRIENLLYSYSELVVKEFENEANSSNRIIYQIKQYINLHYYEDLKLSHLSEQVYLSSNYLSNIFTKHTGCSLNKYIKEVRMQKAQELLLNTNMKVADVGRRVGYENTSYFIKKFQEEFGMTPEKYRMKPIEKEEIWKTKS